MLSENDINDAADELAENGFVRLQKYLGTRPYNFAEIEPTYTLFINFASFSLKYNPNEDIKTVAAAVAASDQLSNADLYKATSLPPTRLNRAVSYLEDYGVVKVLKYLGTAPFNFGEVWATRQTRQFAKDNCK